MTFSYLRGGHTGLMAKQVNDYVPTHLRLQVNTDAFLECLQQGRSSMHGQAAQPFAQGAGQFGSQHELGHIVGAVIQGTLPVILGSLRGQQQQATGGFGIPAMLPQQSYGAQPDVIPSVCE